MDITPTERLILLRMYDICFLSLSDEIAVKLLYDVSSKEYLWKTIKQMEHKQLIKSYVEHKKKFVSFTDSGKRIVKALDIIRRER